jgi:cytochrome c-type biogenesis protein CcmE
VPSNESENNTQQPSTSVSANSSKGLSKGMQIAVGALLVGALLSWFAYTNLAGEGAGFQYYKSLDEFLAQGAALENRSLRVHGYVANNSIQRNTETKQVRFVVQNDPPHKAIADNQTLDVLFQGLETPDLFKDGAEVVIEGRLQHHSSETVFLADNLMAKCPSKFEAESGSPIPESRSDGVNL